MTTATITKPAAKSINTKSYNLLEYAAGHGRVDAKAGVIRRAKICGIESRNNGRTIGLDPEQFGPALDKTYRYSRAALAAAAVLYEGVTLNFGHPPSSRDSEGRRIVKGRATTKPLGTVKNVLIESDGLYGDLFLDLSHPKATFVLESAERSPHEIALSHSAFGVPILKDGRAMIYKILSVESVDVVTGEPGTTNGLFESHLGDPEMSADLKRLMEEAEALRDENSILKSEMAAKEMLETAGVEATAIRCKALALMGSPEDQAALIESWPKAATPAEALEESFRYRRPRSSPPLLLEDNYGQAQNGEHLWRRCRVLPGAR